MAAGRRDRPAFVPPAAGPAPAGDERRRVQPQAGDDLLELRAARIEEARASARRPSAEPATVSEALAFTVRRAGGSRVEYRLGEPAAGGDWILRTSADPSCSGSRP